MGIILAADIGGTQIRVATFTPGKSQPITHKRFPTQSSSGTVFNSLTHAIKSVWNTEVSILSVASAGPLDLETGVVISPSNIPEWNNFPLRAQLEEQFRVPTVIGNDANLAALGEWQYGAGITHNDIVYLTVSTGVGGGVISDGRPLIGHRGLGAELGHITVLPDGPTCPCGQRGHLEALASGPAIASFVNDQLVKGRSSILKADPNLSAREVSRAAFQGDELAKEAFVRAGRFLGTALADLLHIFNPSIVIIGGGVAESWDLFIKPMQQTLEKHVMDPNYLKDLIFTKAQLGDNAGLMGAYAVALQKLAEQQNIPEKI